VLFVRVRIRADHAVPDTEKRGHAARAVRLKHWSERRRIA